MKTRCGFARMGLVVILTITTGCAGVPPHLELPTLDIKQDSEQTTPVITGLDYGAASGYILTKEHVTPGTGLFIYDHVTNDTIRRLTKPYVQA